MDLYNYIIYQAYYSPLFWREVVGKVYLLAQSMLLPEAVATW